MPAYPRMKAVGLKSEQAERSLKAFSCSAATNVAARLQVERCRLAELR
jgi:hypothetical protein